MNRRCLGLCRPGRARTGRTLLLVLLLALMVSAGIVLGAYGWTEYEYRSALAALERHDLAQAQEHLNFFLKIRAHNAQAHLLAARVARRGGDFESAERELRAYEKLQHTSPEGALEWTLLRAQQGDLEQNESLLRSLLEKSPDRALILEALAQGYIQTMRMHEGLECLDRLLEVDPGHYQAYVWRGVLEDNLDGRDDALRDFARAVELAPHFHEARLRLAEELYHLGRPREAIAHYEYLRTREPENADVLLGLARCRFDLAEWPAADALLDTLLAGSPSHAAAFTERGRLAFHERHPEQAETWLRQAVKLAPHDRAAHYLLHLALEAQDKRAEDQKVVARLREIEADSSRLTTLLSRLKEAPRDPGVRTEIGQVLLRVGREPEGEQSLRTALQYDPRFAPAHAALADYYERIGQGRLAAKHRRLGH
jgi:tetratricopeptide (TPR) repeat protein